MNKKPVSDTRHSHVSQVWLRVKNMGQPGCLDSDNPASKLNVTRFPFKKLATTLLRVGISVLLLVFLFRMVDARAIWQLVKGADVASLVVSCLIIGIINFLCLIRWYVLLRASGVSVTLNALLRPFCAGLFFNILLPTSLGGDIVRMVDLSNNTGKGACIASSVLFDRLVGYVALVAIVLLSCIFGWRYVEDPVVLGSIAAITALLICILVVLFNPFAYSFVNGLLYSPTAGRIRSLLTHAHEQIYLLGKKKNAVYNAMVISIVMQLFSSFSSYIICRGLGAEISIIYFLVFIPIIGAISMLPISLGGLGVRDTSTVYFLQRSAWAATRRLLCRF